MRAHAHLISLQTTRTLRLHTASQPILTSLVPITTHAQVSAQGAFNKQILLTKATTTTNLEKTNCCSCYMNQLSLFSLYPCFQVYNFLPVVLGKFLKVPSNPSFGLMPCNLLDAGRAAQQLGTPRYIRMHSGSEGRRLVVQKWNIGQENQKPQNTHGLDGRVGSGKWGQESKLLNYPSWAIWWMLSLTLSNRKIIGTHANCRILYKAKVSSLT